MPGVDALWFKTAVIYELHIRAFYDSNGDGIGDIEGLRRTLPYLESLGVNCLWLLPMYPSPLRDDGYDISDYYSIHPDCGTIDDFQNLLEEAHHRGIRILTELVLNHTSDAHPWFQEARANPHSPRRHWYVWSDDESRYASARIIFRDHENSNWAWDPMARQYFWHRFYSHQPDLNFDNPEVQEEMLNVMRFWLKLGVDGFRVDAVPYLFEREGTNCQNPYETHAYIKRLRAIIDREFPGRLLLAEANQWPSDVRAYFGEGDEFHMGFRFPLMPRLYMALRKEDRRPIVEIMQQTPEIPETCQWAIFLRNHDELTLEMVTDEDRDYMYREYAKDPRMRLNLGIRRRLGPLLDNSRRRVELLNSLLFSLPGTPVIYYGDEIGMGDNIYLGDRNGVRTPMQWNIDRNGGFSRADSARLFAPVIIDQIYGYQSTNVESQERMETSLLGWMKQMITLRRSLPVLGTGRLEFLHPNNRAILAFIRGDLESEVLVVCNLSGHAQATSIDLARWQGRPPRELFGNIEFPKITNSPYQLTFSPYGFFWFQLPHSASAP